MRTFEKILVGAILFLIIVVICLFWRINSLVRAYNGITNIDSNIVINNYYDTNIHYTTTNTNTIIKPTNTIIIDTNINGIDSTVCDSIRYYNPKSEDTNLIIYSNIRVCGKLLDYSNNYKFLKPTLREIIKTYNIPIKENGALLGLGVLYNTNSSKLEYGVNVGYKQNDFIFGGGIYTNSTVTLGVSKLFNKK